MNGFGQAIVALITWIGARAIFYSDHINDVTMRLVGIVGHAHLTGIHSDPRRTRLRDAPVSPTSESPETDESNWYTRDTRRRGRELENEVAPAKLISHANRKGEKERRKISRYCLV